MKKLSNLILYLFICCLSAGYAQDYEFKNYDFSDRKIDLPAKYADENEVILEKNIKIELVPYERGAFQVYLMHDKTLINSDDAIERNNRVYIPFRLDESLLTNKVRVILKNGTVINLRSQDIKEEIDEEKGLKYHYYAVNGLEKGAILEKIFVIKENPDLKGLTLKMQMDVPIVNLSFELIAPSHLGFKYKSYNGLPEATLKEDAYPNKHVISVTDTYIDGLPDDEQYANQSKYQKMFRYKLDSNSYSGAKNLFSYSEFASNVYENIHVEIDKKSEKEIDNFVSKIPKSSKLEEQIGIIENRIKSTITFNRYYEGNKSLGDIVKNKQADEVDLLRFYIAVFKKFKIETQIVMTSKRFSKYFDPDFESTEQLENVLLYFPAVNKYLEPNALEYRFPLFNFNYGENYGLFIKEKEFGGAKMGIGSIEKIEIPNQITHDYMDIVIDFSKDIENPTIHTKIKYGGYSALNFQPIKDFVSEEEYREILKDITKNYTLDTDYKTLKTENDGLENVGKKPFILDVTFEGKDYTQKAGGNILFKAGETIGRQMEFYQVEKRELPVEIYYPHYYTRTLKFILPKGYKIKNLDEFNMNFKTEINGKEVAGFKSSYTQKGNEITVSNYEYYSVVHYPLEVFEPYRAVINAAADFQKINIILTKE